MRVPFIFSSKDAVSDQCITMALHGGIGILHSNFSTPADQAAEISKVKRHNQGFIPRCVGSSDSVLDLSKHEKEFALVTSNGEIGGKLLGS